MLKTEHWAVYNFEGALRGMRNAMDSWDKSDSYIEYVLAVLSGTDPNGKETAVNISKENFVFGEADLKLAQNLCKGGPSHRKYLRQIFISVDITAPLFLLKELDTYTVGTTKNSCSTMHTIHYYPITGTLFSTDGMSESGKKTLESYLTKIEKIRKEYLAGGKTDKQAWRDIICMLPSSWNQKRTITFSYETLLKICEERDSHRLSEWSQFIEQAKQACPYFDELIGTYLRWSKERAAKLANYDKIADTLNIYEALYGPLTDKQIEEAHKVIEMKSKIEKDKQEPKAPEKVVLAIRTLAPEKKPEVKDNKKK